MDSVAEKAQQGLGYAESQIAIDSESHFGRLNLVARLPGGAQPIFEQRFINTNSKTILAQNFQACDIIFVAVLMFHGEITGDIGTQ